MIQLLFLMALVFSAYLNYNKTVEKEEKIKNNEIMIKYHQERRNKIKNRKGD